MPPWGVWSTQNVNFQPVALPIPPTTTTTNPDTPSRMSHWLRTPCPIASSALSVNCYAFLGKIVKWFSVFYGLEFSFPFLDWLLSKMREPRLLCYLTHKLEKRWWIQAFPKVISGESECNILSSLITCVVIGYTAYTSYQREKSFKYAFSKYSKL